MQEKPEIAKSPQKTKTAARSPNNGAAGAPADGPADVPADVLEALSKLDIRVGQAIVVEKVKGSTQLFKVRVEMGGGIQKWICTGLQRYYTVPDLNGRKLVCYNNIKPCKMAGEPSEAMILCGVYDDHGPDEICELLDFEDPEAVTVGTKITIEGLVDHVGSEAAEASVKYIRKQWEKVQPLFSIEDTKAFFGKGRYRLTAGGVPIVVKALKEGGIF